GGAGVQDWNELGLVLGELALEQLPEEVVVAVRLATAVERNEEEVGALDLGELRARPLVVEHCVADRAGHPIEDRRAAEEAQRPRPEAIQVFSVEVVREVTVVSVQRRGPVAQLLAVSDRERREVERRRPALALLDQLRLLRFGQRHARRAEEHLSLALAQREGVRAEFDQPSAGAQRRKP